MSPVPPKWAPPKPAKPPAPPSVPVPISTEGRPLAVAEPDPAATTTGAMTTQTVPMPMTAAELPRNANGETAVGTIVAVPLAPAKGDIDVPAGTPVAVVVQDFLKNTTIRVALALVYGAFALFLGYVALQVLQGQVGKDFAWYFDVLIVGGFGLGIMALTFFWNAPLVCKVRNAVLGALAAFFGYVGFVIISNNGLDGIDWHKTTHVGLNFAIVALVGGVLALSKLFDNNPITKLPWKSDPK